MWYSTCLSDVSLPHLTGTRPVKRRLFLPLPYPDSMTPSKPSRVCGSFSIARVLCPAPGSPFGRAYLAPAAGDVPKSSAPSVVRFDQRLELIQGVATFTSGRALDSRGMAKMVRRSPARSASVIAMGCDHTRKSPMASSELVL